MELEQDFSYSTYQEIIKKYSGLLIDYEDVTPSKNFALIRHDVEFDVARALEMAKIDCKFGVKSTFLFQVRSNAYNVFSKVNVEAINNIKEMGLSVGLHAYVTHIQEHDWKALNAELLAQKAIMEIGLGLKIDRFSFHRPADWVLKNRSDVMNGLLNLYGGSFFEHTKTPKTPKHIKYLADSRHRWDYGHPLENHNYKKFHLMIHPDEWFIRTLGEAENFEKLNSDHMIGFRQTLEAETTNFSNAYSRNKP